jgi:class 3 adenylate cyclase
MHFEEALWIPAPPEAVWPLMADTERLNREIGLPPIRFEFRPREAGGTDAWAEARLAGLTLRYREHPFEWVRPAFYRIRRTFEGGPIREFVGEVRLSPEPRERTDGTRVSSHVTLEVAGPAGAAAGRVLGGKAMRDFAGACRGFAAYLEQRAATPYPRHAALPPADRERLERIRAALGPFSPEPELLDRLIAYLVEAPPEDVTVIRPFALADAWGRDRLAVLQACLVGARVGLLDLRWRVLCPACRGALAGVVVLRELGAAVHCETCNIRYDAQFDQNVEVCFAVPPAIRPVTASTYCVGGPGRTPHVAAQWLLGPGEERETWVELSGGRYDLRSLQAGVCPIRVAEEEGPPVDILIEEHAGERRLRLRRLEAQAPERGASDPEPVLPARATWRVHNATSVPVVLRLEEEPWRTDVATAARVTSLQSFRDLFSSEVLAPGLELSVRQLAILFTDLKGSTALYRRIGDAPSYRLVRDTFDFLRRVVGEHRGCVVKTIGDAVMAAFADPADAMAAGLAIQRRASQEVPEGLPIKLGLHWGPVIAVNANDLLDYFGQTVNLASRLRDLSQGGDVVFAASLAEDPRVAGLLAQSGASPERFDAPVRGLDEPVTMMRVRVAGEAIHRAG